MLGGLKRWRTRRMMLLEEVRSRDANPKNHGLPRDPKVLRKIRDRTLDFYAQRHVSLADGAAVLADFAAVQREVRERAEWRAPSGRAFWISVAALAVSAVSLAVSFFR